MLHRLFDEAYLKSLWFNMLPELQDCWHRAEVNPSETLAIGGGILTLWGIVAKYVIEYINATAWIHKREAISISSFCLTIVWIPTIKTRQSHDHLIFIMGIPTSDNLVFILKQVPSHQLLQLQIHGLSTHYGLVRTYSIIDLSHQWFR